MPELATRNLKIINGNQIKKDDAQVCNGSKLSDEQSAPTYDFERLLTVGRVNSTLDETTTLKEFDTARKAQLKQELKNNMKNVMTTVLNKYTQYLTQAFQLSIQTQLKQVSHQQALLMKVFKQSIEQTLELMHRPQYINPSVITDDPDKYNIEISSKHSTIGNTRKINDLRFRLTNASENVAKLKKQNKQLQQKMERLEKKLKKQTNEKAKFVFSDSMNQYDLWEYIDFVEKHSNRCQIDLNHVSKLVKKNERKYTMQIENSKEAFKDLKVKLVKIDAQKCELTKKLEEYEIRNRNMEKKMQEMEAKYDKKHQEIKRQFKKQLNCEITKLNSIGQGLNSAIENTQIQLTCQCCLSQLKNPVLLKCCGHTICETCIKKRDNDTTLVCGECQCHQENDSLVKLCILQNMINRFESVRYHAEKITKRSC